MFDERQSQLLTMCEKKQKKSTSSMSLGAKDSQVHIERIRVTDKNSSVS